LKRVSLLEAYGENIFLGQQKRIEDVNPVALLLGVGFVCIGALIFAKTWDLPTNEMNRAKVWYRHKNGLYLKWIGLGLIVTGIVLILAALDLPSLEFSLLSQGPSRASVTTSVRVSTWGRIVSLGHRVVDKHAPVH
jgi:hypothetical protein